LNIQNERKEREMKVKNIVFSGVMGAILMSATGASAAISVASQGYVDAKVGAIETNVTENYLSKTDAADTYLTETQVTEQITNVVGSETEGLIKDVADNKAAIAALDDTYATDTELSEGLATKVDAQAQTAVDAKQTEDISKNTAAIEILNGDAETVGSVKNEIKVLSDLLGGTAGDVSGLTTQVSANTTATEPIVAASATIGSVANSIAEAKKIILQLNRLMQKILQHWMPPRHMQMVWQIIMMRRVLRQQLKRNWLIIPRRLNWMRVLYQKQK